MKKTLFIASIIGMFMATAMDLPARSRRSDRSQNVRSGISSGQSRHAPARNRSNSYGQNDNRSGRHVRSGISFGLSRRAPARNRTNSYGRYDNRSGRHGRSVISFGLSMFAPMSNRYNSYGSYDNYPGRNPAREIRTNEERIWNLEQRIDRLYRYGDDDGEIGELEQEINYLERRNDFLRNQLY
jgi:hypothetical protein